MQFEVLAKFLHKLVRGRGWRRGYSDARGVSGIDVKGPQASDLSCWKPILTRESCRVLLQTSPACFKPLRFSAARLGSKQTDLLSRIKQECGTCTLHVLHHSENWLWLIGHNYSCTSIDWRNCSPRASFRECGCRACKHCTVHSAAVCSIDIGMVLGAEEAFDGRVIFSVLSIRKGNLNMRHWSLSWEQHVELCSSCIPRDKEVGWGMMLVGAKTVLYNERRESIQFSVSKHFRKAD